MNKSICLIGVMLIVILVSSVLLANITYSSSTIVRPSNKEASRDVGTGVVVLTSGGKSFPRYDEALGEIALKLYGYKCKFPELDHETIRVLQGNNTIPEEVKEKLREAHKCLRRAQKLMWASILLGLRGYVKKSIIALNSSRNAYLNASSTLKSILDEYKSELPEKLVGFINKTLRRIHYTVTKLIPSIGKGVKNVGLMVISSIRDKAVILSTMLIKLEKRAKANNDTRTMELTNKTLNITRELIKACNKQDIGEITSKTKELVEVGKELISEAKDKYPRIIGVMKRIVHNIVLLVKRLA